MPLKLPLLTLLLLGSSGAAPAPTPVLVVRDSTNLIDIINGDATPTTADGTDFGAYRSGAGIVNHDFTLNVSDADLEITDIEVPSGFAIGESFPFTIEAGVPYTLNIETDATLGTTQVWSGDVVIHGTGIDDYSFAITGSTVYATRVAAQSPLRYFKIDEGSGTVLTDSSANAQNGVTQGLTWTGEAPPQGGQAPFWDGTNDYGNPYNANLGTNFNPNEFTILIWVKVDASGVWTDGVSRYLMRLARNAGTNDIQINKSTANNTIVFTRIANSAQKQIIVGSQSDTGWVCYGLSCSIAGGGLLSAGDVRAYKNRVQIGSTQTGAVNMTNSGLSTTQTTIGASVTTPANVWHGYEAHVQIYNSPMTSDILELMAV